jgi:hypothetical protein
MRPGDRHRAGQIRVSGGFTTAPQALVALLDQPPEPCDQWLHFCRAAHDHIELFPAPALPTVVKAQTHFVSPL